MEAIEGCSQAPDDKLQLVPHVIGSFVALVRANDRLRRVTKDVVNAIAKAGTLVDDLRQQPKVRAIKEHVLKARRTLFSEDYCNTILAISNLAATLGEQGQLIRRGSTEKEGGAKEAEADLGQRSSYHY